MTSTSVSRDRADSRGSILTWYTDVAHGAGVALRVPVVAVILRRGYHRRCRARAARARLTTAARENTSAINAATLFELDDVMDPVETRGLIAETFAAAPILEPGGRGFVDTC